MVEDIYNKYYLDELRVQELLKNELIVFDTSALLDLYNFSEETQNNIFEIVFPSLRGRLWIPAQVYFEFLKNKEEVIKKPKLLYEKLRSTGKGKEDGGVP